MSTRQSYTLCAEKQAANEVFLEAEMCACETWATCKQLEQGNFEHAEEEQQNMKEDQLEGNYNNQFLNEQGNQQEQSQCPNQAVV